jgi:hypothetical protein
MAKSAKTTAKPAVAKAADPLNVNARLYAQLGKMLDQLEEEDSTITLRERIAALIAVGRLQVIFKGLRSEDRGAYNVGTTVNRYSNVFAKNASRGRAPNRGGAAAAVVQFDRHDDEDDDI